MPMQDVRFHKETVPLRYDAMSIIKQLPTFRKSLPPPSLRSKQSKHILHIPEDLS
jgi:hypothetical protein